jgi:hypothetical protein
MLILPIDIFWVRQVLTRLQTNEFTIDVSDPKSDRRAIIIISIFKIFFVLNVMNAVIS